MRVLFLFLFLCVQTVLYCSDTVNIVVHCVVKNDDDENPCGGRPVIHQHTLHSVFLNNTVYEVMGKVIITHDKKLRADTHLCELSSGGYNLMQLGKFSLRKLSTAEFLKQKNKTIHIRCVWSHQDEYSEKIYKSFLFDFE